MGGKYACPFCLVNLKTNAQWKAEWPIMRQFDANNKLIPNETGLDHINKAGKHSQIIINRTILNFFKNLI
jgi:hypothetical protein